MATAGEQQLNIHQLLCKKVAQLTKVVYQLNVKSEDRDIDLNLIAKSYESQIDQIAVDNEQKIKQIQEQFKKHQSDLESEVVRLLADVKRLEKEKVQFLGKFNEYKQENDTKMTRFKDATKQRIDQLILEVDALRRDNIDDVRNSRKAARDELMRVSAELRGQNEALAAQLTQMAAARDKLQAEKDALSKELEAKEKQSEDLKQQLNALLKEKMSAGDAAQKRIDALQKQLDEAHKQSLNSGDQISQLVKRIDSLEATLKKTQSSYEQECKVIASLRTEKDALTAKVNEQGQEIYKHAATIKDLEQKLRDTEVKCTTLDKTVEEKNKLLEQLQTDKKSLNAEVSDLRKRLEDMQTKSTVSSESERKLQLALENATKEASFFRTQLSDANAKIDELKVQLASECTTKKKAQSELAAANTKVGGLEAEIQQLRSDMINEKSNELTKYAQMEESLQKQIAELRTQFEETRKAAEEKFSAQIEAHATEIAALKQAFKNKEDEYLATIAMLEESLAKLQADMTKLTSDLGATRDLNASLAEKTQDEIQKLRSKLARYNLFKDSVAKEIKQFCSSLRDTCTTVLQRVRADQVSTSHLLEESATGILQRITQYITHMQTAIASNDSAKAAYEAQIEGLRRQIESLETGAKSKDRELAKAAQEIDNLKQMLDNYRFELGTVREEVEAKRKELESMTVKYGDAVNTSTARAKEIEALNGRIKDLNDKIAEMEGLLGNTINSTSAEAVQLRKKITELEARLAKEMEAHQNALIGKDEQLAAMQKEMQDARERMQSLEWEILKLTENFNITIADKNAALALLQKEHAVQLQQERARIEKLTEESTILSGELETSRQKIANLMAMHEKEIIALQKELAASNERIQSIQESEMMYKEKVQSLEARMQRMTADATKKLDEEFRKGQEALNALKKEHQLKIQKLKDDHQQQLADAEDTLARAMREAEQVKNELIAQIESLKAEFKNRPSRLEDMELINQLKALLEQREQELDAAAKAVLYYKRELLAREEAYNKRFHKDNSRVGTMQIPGVPAHAMNAQQTAVINNMMGAPLGTTGLNVSAMGTVSNASFSQTGAIGTRISRGSASPKAKRPLSNNGLGAKGNVPQFNMPKHLPTPL